MRCGAHLPVIDLGNGLPKVRDVVTYARLARDAGFRHFCANDHLVFARRGSTVPTALAAASNAAGDMTVG